MMIISDDNDDTALSLFQMGSEGRCPFGNLVVRKCLRCATEGWGGAAEKNKKQKNKKKGFFG
jgi:hypothetical protein